MSVTGDVLADAMADHASRLVWAVREHDAAEVAAVLETVRAESGVDALVLVLAAMVPDDATPSELLAWLHDPTLYRRLRESGVDALQAGAMCRFGSGEKVTAVLGVNAA